MDIRPIDAQKRVRQNVNHIAWLAGNLVSIRYRLGTIIGLKERETFFEIFKDNRPIQNHITYPDLVPIQEDWHRITPLLRERLAILTDEKLLSPQTVEIPIDGEPNLLHIIYFFIDKESYALGQMGLLRQLFGYEANTYN